MLSACVIRTARHGPPLVLRCVRGARHIWTIVGFVAPGLGVVTATGAKAQRGRNTVTIDYIHWS